MLRQLPVALDPGTLVADGGAAIHPIAAGQFGADVADLIEGEDFGNVQHHDGILLLRMKRPLRAGGPSSLAVPWLDPAGHVILDKAGVIRAEADQAIAMRRIRT
jgi:hypothetical protein